MVEVAEGCVCMILEANVQRRTRGLSKGRFNSTLTVATAVGRVVGRRHAGVPVFHRGQP